MNFRAFILILPVFIALKEITKLSATRLLSIFDGKRISVWI